jgi:hypothetical protein
MTFSNPKSEMGSPRPYRSDDGGMSQVTQKLFVMMISETSQMDLLPNL